LDPTLVSIALGAGALSTFAPCNVGMIPSYLSASASFTGTSKARSIVTGGTTVLGYLTLQATFGLLLALSFRAVIAAFPFAALFAGSLLLIMGSMMVLDIRNPVTSTLSLKLPRTKGLIQFYLLGLAYAAVSLSCTLPLLLMVANYAAVIGNSLTDATTAMATYAAGVTLVLMMLSLVAASSKSIIRRVRATSSRYQGVIAGSVITVAALYLVMYQLYHLVGGIP